MKTTSTILFSLLLFTFTNELKAQVGSYDKLILEYKIENGKIVYQNISSKKPDTTFYFEFNYHYVKGTSFKEGTITYKYHLTNSEIIDGEIDLENWRKMPIKINPEPTTLDYDTKKGRHVITIKDGKNKTEYIFKYYSAINLTWDEYEELK